MPRQLFILIFGAIMVAIAGCAILGGGEDPGVKNKNIAYVNPPSPYEKVNVSSADSVWQSKKTGNTIALNSLCQKYEDVSLENLEKNILAGIENLEIQEQKTVPFDGREAQRVRASGSADGVAIAIDLLILKKNNCTYDLTYIARKNNFEAESKVFEDFLRGFRVP